jgi:hypothetical protein
VPWARPNARHNTDFDNVVAWLAQRTPGYCSRLQQLDAWLSQQIRQQQHLSGAGAVD